MNMLSTVCIAFAEEEMKNITPTLLRFLGKFAVIFAVIAVLAVLTPKMASKVDAFREKHQKSTEKDPRYTQVRGIYDMPQQEESEEHKPK